MFPEDHQIHLTGALRDEGERLIQIGGDVAIAQGRLDQTDARPVHCSISAMCWAIDARSLSRMPAMTRFSARRSMERPSAR